MKELFAELIPFVILISHIILGLIVVSIIFRKSISSFVPKFVGKYAAKLALLVSLGAIFGSLFYSQIVGFEPCVLCWWQRVFIFPMPVILLVALRNRFESVFSYLVPLALLALVVSGYHSYVELGGGSLLPCTAEGGACSRVYVNEFGYITIPTMSMTVSLFVLVLAWARKIYRNENSNA